MADPHVTFELLAAHDAGRITRQEVLEFATRHLLSGCRPCAAEYGAFAAERGAEPAWSEADREPEPAPDRVEHGASEYARVVRGVADAASELEQHLQREAVQAARELRELLALPHEEALAKVHRARIRFRSPALAQLLLAEVRAALPDRPRQALERAELAEKVAWRLTSRGRPLPALQAELGVLAVAHQGNAHRVLDDLRAADHAFDFARGAADHNGVVDPAVLAELDALEGSLRRDQRRFGEAERLLRRSVTLAVAAEDRLRVVRSLLKLGILYHHWDRPAEAFGHAEAAAQVMPSGAPRRLRLCAVHNQIDSLCELGEYDVAGELLAEARQLYAGFDDLWTTGRLAWVQAKMARGRGELESATRRLAAARDGFSSSGAQFDTGLVSLELSDFLYSLGKRSKALRSAEKALRTFQELEIAREVKRAQKRIRWLSARHENRGTTLPVLGDEGSASLVEMRHTVHLSKDLLSAVYQGRIHDDRLDALVLEHLASRCRVCAEEIAAWATWRRLRSTPQGAAGVLEALKILLRELPEAAETTEEARRRAARELEELRPLPQRERLERVERPRTSRTGPELAELCLEVARGALPGHPREALEWAQVAERAAVWSFGRRGRERIQALAALARAHQGNALRILEDFPRAEACFADAAGDVRLTRVTDPVILAEIHRLEASLHRALRRFEAAQHCLEQAELLYRVVGDAEQSARIHLKLGTLWHARGRPEKSLQAADRAAAALPAEADARSRLAISHNRADCLCDLGRPMEALDVLEEARFLYDLFDDPWTRLRLAWLEGKIAHGRGDPERAEEHLRAAREGFLAEESAYDAALVSLELALLYLEDGRTQEIRRLAHEMVATFRAVGVHREALAAATLFAEAAERDRISARQIGLLAFFVRRAAAGVDGS